MTTPYDTALENFRNRKFSESVTGFHTVLALEPRHMPAHYHLGQALYELGRAQEGIEHYRTVLKKYPDYVEAWINLGDLCGKAGLATDAIHAWQQAVALDPENVLALNNLGLTCSNLGRPEEAVRHFRQAAAIAPDRHDLWLSLGNALMGLSRFACAEKALRQALRIDPKHAQTHNNLAVTLGHLKRNDEAIAAFRLALQADPALADGLNNLALALYKIDVRDEALALLRRCVEQHPGYALGWANLGMVLQGMGQLEEAVQVIDRALALTPDQAGWLWNQSLAYLTMGDFERGWKHFEMRYSKGKADPQAVPPELPFPMWRGESLAGKRILLVKEQGFGDQIQCLRFAQNLVALGAEVGVWLHPAMVPLAASVADVHVAVTEAPTGAYDFWTFLMSLPVHFNAGLDNLPGPMPYVQAKADKVEVVRQRIEAFAGGRMRVGINWAGNPSHPNDHNRSLPLPDLATLLDLADIAWVSLQKDRAPASDAWVARGCLLPLGDAVVDFSDTAAIIAALDLVVTIDSAIAHLAGAMGARTWLLLPANPDYRWMLERTDSPWYPSMTLWRQPRLGDWSTTLALIVRSLLQESDGLTAPVGFRRCMPLAGHQRMVSGRHGWFVYNHHDQYVGQALEHYGEYGEHEVALFARIMQGFQACDAIEVGSNIGSQSVPLSRLARRLYAFEPQPTIFQTLCANLAINDVRNCQAFPMGSGECDGTFVVPPVGYDSSGNFGSVSLAPDGQGTPVQVVALDSFMASLVPDLRVRLIKVDVEGMERAVLMGARQQIARDRPFLYVENDRIDQSEALICSMREMGYRLYWHCPLLFNGNNFFANAENIYNGIAAINMLGVPNEVAFDVTGMAEVGAANVHILTRN